MSLWTPDGEHTVNRDPDVAPVPPDARPVPDDSATAADYDDFGDQDAQDDAFGGQGAEIDAETSERMQEQLAQAQAQLLAAPVQTVVSNHVMGLFELAALHLRSEESELDNARLAIDAMGLLVDNLGDRLAEHETLASALTQLRMAYVEAKKSQDSTDD